MAVVDATNCSQKQPLETSLYAHLYAQMLAGEATNRWHLLRLVEVVS
jgi:hypothetical protein